MTTNQFGPNGSTPDNINSLEGKTFLITGANSGAGFEASEKILSTLPNIDALICNGTIAQVAKQELTVDGFESQLGVNHFGHFLLCGLLFDRIEASAGRIVVVGSNAYKMGLKKIQFNDLNFDEKYTAWNSYAQSKLAQMMFAYELQRRIKATGKQVQVHVCHPGASRTNLLKDTASTFNKILWAILSKFIAQSAHKGAWPEVMCATETGLEPQSLYGPTKRADTVGDVGKCSLDNVALNEEMATELWDVSVELAGLMFVKEVLTTNNAIQPLRTSVRTALICGSCYHF